MTKNGKNIHWNVIWFKLNSLLSDILLWIDRSVKRKSLTWPTFVSINNNCCNIFISFKIQKEPGRFSMLLIIFIYTTIPTALCFSIVLSLFAPFIFPTVASSSSSTHIHINNKVIIIIYITFEYNNAHTSRFPCIFKCSCIKITNNN